MMVPSPKTHDGLKTLPSSEKTVPDPLTRRGPWERALGVGLGSGPWQARNGSTSSGFLRPSGF